MEGHRQRIYEKFLIAPESFSKRDIIELICCLCIPRKDVKQLTISIDMNYETLLDFLNEPWEVLSNKFKLTKYTISNIKLIYEVVKRIHREKIIGKNLINVFDYMVEYCKNTMGANRYEELRVIFINNRNEIITDEVLFSGTINNILLYPREIFRRCFELKASSIVLVHNHPSGNCEPSAEDIELTKILLKIGIYISVSIYDHIIVSTKGFWSFRQNGLIV